MLVIRADQTQLLRLSALEQFKVDLLRQLAGFAPELHALRGDEVFRRVIDEGVSRAARYGFTHRGPLRFFVECMLSYGSEFDTDLQIRGLPECLRQVHGNGQSWHADRAFAAVERYQIQTRGRRNEHTLAALRRLGPFLERLDTLQDESLEADLLRLMATVHPEKFDFVGQQALRLLVARAREAAHRSGLTSAAGIGLICGLMFALGQGVVRDPLYPWVGATLDHRRVREPARRVELLRRKTRWYLAATLNHLPVP